MKDHTRQQGLTIGLFGIYMLALIWIVVLKFQLSLDTLPATRAINRIPFYVIGVLSFFITYRF